MDDDGWMVDNGWMVDDGESKPEKQEEGCSKLSASMVNLNFWLKIGKKGLHF